MDEDYDQLPDIPNVDDTFANTTLGDLVKDHQDGAVGDVIPFRAVHDPPVKFKSIHRKIFIPGEDIHVKFITYERSVTTNLMNPYLYTIQFTHGKYIWTVHKRYKHIQHLHQQLKLFRTSLNIPFPTKSHREHRQSFKQQKRDSANDEDKKTKQGSLPLFPNTPEVLVGYDQIEERVEELENYLNNLLKIKLYRSHNETVYFLTASHLSFVSELGFKGIEGFVKKRTGSTRKGGCDFCGLLDSSVCSRCSTMCSDLFGQWRERWLFLKDTFVGYIRPRDGRVQGIMLFDQGFEVSTGLYSTGLRNRLQIVNTQRRIMFKCWTKRKREEWCNALKDVTSKQGYGFTQKNRNSSYAPVRNDTSSCWFVDGATFMSAVADAIDQAKEEIYIADWWLSPEIYLKRPVLNTHEWRLDMLLHKKAEEGVKIFVLLYKEVELALGINSYYSKSRLNSCHDNIKVLRHPDHANSGVFLWAHHEKIVCIDQTHAFVGGIDLCYGRWDDYSHRLVDLGGQTKGLTARLTGKLNSSRPLGTKSSTLLKLAQASNLVSVGALSSSQVNLSDVGESDEDVEPVVNMSKAVSDVEVKLTNGDVELLDQLGEEGGDNFVAQPTAENVKCNTPEMERKTMYSKLKDSVGRTSRHLMFKMKSDDDEESVASEDLAIEEEKRESEAHEKLQIPVIVTNVENIAALAELPECPEQTEDCKYWIGKDYANFIVKDLCNLDTPYQDLVDRTTTPRMPWHDIGVFVHGAAARDVARHFIQRWNAVKLEKAKRLMQYPYLMPKSYEHFDEPLNLPGKSQYKVTCQVLRSSSSWSAGFLDPDMWEESIHEAYINVISKSEHYIYIENQFFISLARQNPDVKNQVCEALCKRILKAHKDGKQFRVYVVMPLLPGFEGEVGAPSGTAIHTVTHWNYLSISRGKDAIITRLIECGIEDPSRYITFHGLRKWSELHGELVSELIYVHSKLMIVDDKHVICGSANINDRSLLGKRDSEIAVLIEDEELIEGKMNNETYMIGKYASTLRKFLFNEHLGLITANNQDGSCSSDCNIDINDPVCDEFYVDQWLKISEINTRLFEEVFQCLPSDRVLTFKDLPVYQRAIPLCQSDPVTSSRKLENIQGHLVDLPLKFLEGENLTPNPNSVEGMLPTALWT